MKYKLIATVFRQVTDTILLSVDASDKDEAYGKARQVLEKYPEGHDVDGVPFCFVENRELHEPHLLSLSAIHEPNTDPSND